MQHLYLIQGYEFVKSKESIYTIGQCDGKCGYSYGDALFYENECNDDIIANVIKMFKIKYIETSKHRFDTFSMNFEGNVFEMIQDIVTIYAKASTLLKKQNQDKSEDANMRLLSQVSEHFDFQETASKIESDDSSVFRSTVIPDVPSDDQTDDSGGDFSKTINESEIYSLFQNLVTDCNHLSSVSKKRTQSLDDVNEECISRKRSCVRNRYQCRLTYISNTSAMLLLNKDAKKKFRDWTNVFVNRIYEDIPLLLSMESDVAAFDTQYSLLCHDEHVDVKHIPYRFHITKCRTITGRSLPTSAKKHIEQWFSNLVTVYYNRSNVNAAGRYASEIGVDDIDLPSVTEFQFYENPSMYSNFVSEIPQNPFTCIEVSQ